jgi:hypothetical protein
MKTRLITGLASSMLVLGALTGCTDDTEPATDATDTETTESEPSDAETTESEPTEGEPTESEPTEGEGGATGATGGDVTEFCDSFSELSKTGPDAISPEAARGEIEDLVASAPQEVQTDVGVIDSNYRALFNAIEQAGLDINILDGGTEVPQRVRNQIQRAAAAAGYDQAAAGGAVGNVQTWATENCEGSTPQ